MAHPGYACSRLKMPDAFARNCAPAIRVTRGRRILTPRPPSAGHNDGPESDVGAPVLLARAGDLRRAGIERLLHERDEVLPVLDALRSERDAALAGTQDMLAYQTALADWEALLGGGR